MTSLPTIVEEEEGEEFLQLDIIDPHEGWVDEAVDEEEFLKFDLPEDPADGKRDPHPQLGNGGHRQLHQQAGRSDSELEVVIHGIEGNVQESQGAGSEVTRSRKRKEPASQVPVPVGKRKKHRSHKPQKPCPIPGCEQVCSYEKRHAYAHHIPGIFAISWNFNLKGLVERRVEALQEMAEMLGKEKEGIRGLWEVVNGSDYMQPYDNPNRDETKHMRAISEYIGENWKGIFRLYPVETIGSLLHWRALTSLLRLMSAEQRDQLWDKYYQVDRTRGVVPGFDAHFHLDRMLAVIPSVHSDGLLSAVASSPWERVKWMTKEKEEEFYLKGGCTSYCDPSSWPSVIALEGLPGDLVVAVGLHPKTVGQRQVSPDQLATLKELVEHPRVAALGEVGIDHTAPQREWDKQDQGLTTILQLLKPREMQRKTLVLHCRGKRESIGHKNEYDHLLKLLKTHIPNEMRLYLHSFQGHKDTLNKWRETFPNCYFGFNRSVENFSTAQQEALRSVPMARLVVETDAPYFPRSTHGMSTPSQLLDAIELVAGVRGVAPARVGIWSDESAAKLYGIFRNPK